MKRSFIGAVLAAVLIFAWLAADPVVMAHDPTPLDLTDMVILTNGEILIQGQFDVDGGEVCSRNGPITIGGHGTVRIPDDYPNTRSDVILGPAAVNPIELRNFSRIAHIRSNLAVNVTGTSGVAPVILSDPALDCPSNPPFPAFNASNDPADDITCTQAGTDIVPGTYRDLNVELNGVCNFRGPGDYTFRNVFSPTNSNYKFNFLDAPVDCDPLQFPYNLRVKGYMYLGEFGDFNENVTRSVFVYVEGVDGLPGNPAPKGEAFWYQGDGALIACWVYAPNGTIGLRGIPKHETHSHYHAVFIANAFHQSEQNLRVRLAKTIAPECCGVAPDCFCILDFFDLAEGDKTIQRGQTLRLLGKGLDQSNVDQVHLIPTAAIATVDVTNPGSAATCSIPQADITFTPPGSMDLVIPAACTDGDYYVAAENSAFFIDRVNVLTISGP
ncbi:MAG: hypothetical protein C4530_16520 [Desulfobacteraceae bacterium]|nr:MAG: hypothetical protein C4530_16520 [Desulfobacteraceae bacterium]